MSADDKNCHKSIQTEGNCIINDFKSSTLLKDLTVLQEWEFKLRKVGKSLEQCAQKGKINSKIELHHAAWTHNTKKVFELCKNNSENVNDSLHYAITPLHLAAFKGFNKMIDILMEYGAESDCVMDESDIQAVHIAAGCGSISSLRSILKRDAVVEHTDKSGKTALHWAAGRGHTNCIRELIKFQGSDPNTSDDLNHKPLCYAFYSQHKFSIKELLKLGSDLSCDSCMGQDGYKLLFWLVKNKLADCLELLVKRRNIKINVNCKNEEEISLLTYALQTGDFSILMTLLVDIVGGIEYINEFGSTLLHIAAKENVASAIPTLLSSLDLNEKNTDGWTPLHVAAYNGHLEVVNTFLAHRDIQVNKKQKDGYTPLGVAVKKSNLEVVSALLKHRNVQVNEKNNSGRTPLYIAVRKGELDIVNSLLTHNDILVNEKNENDLTPLHAAVLSGNIEVVNALLTLPDIQVNEKNKDGLTPFHIAAFEGNLEVVNALMVHRFVRINKKSEDGTTPLLIAAQCGNLEVVNTLLSRPDIQVNEKDSHSWTPLHAAILNGHLKVVSALLLQPDIKVNEKDKNGWTHLHFAAISGNLEIVDALLIHPDIQVNEKNNEGLTSIYTAARGGHEEVVKRLRLDKRVLFNEEDLNIDKENSISFVSRDGFVKVVVN